MLPLVWQCFSFVYFARTHIAFGLIFLGGVFMKRIRVFLLSCALFVFCAFGFAACNKGGEVECSLLSSNDTQVVIRVDKTDGNAVLLNAMESLQEKGEITFIMSNGMITGINGVENDVDYNPCWMLYTSDSEMASMEWGSVEYDGLTLGSAIVGAGDLTLVAGAVYVWSYQGF